MRKIVYNMVLGVCGVNFELKIYLEILKVCNFIFVFGVFECNEI